MHIEELWKHFWKQLFREEFKLLPKGFEGTHEETVHEQVSLNYSFALYSSFLVTDGVLRPLLGSKFAIGCVRSTPFMCILVLYAC